MQAKLNFLVCHLQLYVSVDAATKDSLKAIDRPLFGDFWERFIVSIFLFTVKNLEVSVLAVCD